MNTPLPPVNSCDMSAAGPEGRGCVVVVAAVVDGAAVVSALLLLLLEQAAAANSATHTIATAVRQRRCDTAFRRSTVAILTPPVFPGPYSQRMPSTSRA